ncbi:hypothetical protein P4O66_017094 [Electrophorus voltai]|uniref:Cytoplasmic 60S subunit biogenesis factor ZNF622 n=1 Tax=Electrophorus voltai TaxID=2609070 RepID=A0AAD8YU05_9TELE|nr:hypothetical protein P4O66_017094 [Electrophorus voltai]
MQRAHYKTDWHRYNLKRKVAAMPPVTAESFQARVLAQRTASEQQSPGPASVCSTCSKRFSSANAYANHLQSSRHQHVESRALAAARDEVQRLNEKNLEKGAAALDKDAQNEALQRALRERQRRGPAKATPTERRGQQRPSKAPRLRWFEQQAKKIGAEEEEEEEEEEEWEDVDDDEDDDDDEEMEADEEEQVVGAGASASAPAPGVIPATDCLFCDHHSRSLGRNVTHMTKVHSFFLPDIEYLVDLRGLVTYLGEKVGVGKVCLWCNERGRSFYTTEAVQAHMNDKGHCKLYTDGDAALEFADFYDFRSSYPDAKDGDDLEMKGEELPDEKTVEFDDETLELTLPSGAKIGHRSLMRYYKQRFGAQRALVPAHSQRAVGRVLKQYRALGWAGEPGKSFVTQQQKDMQYVQRMKAKWLLRMGVSNNVTKQTYFRHQVMF